MNALRKGVKLNSLDVLNKLYNSVIIKSNGIISRNVNQSVLIPSILHRGICTTAPVRGLMEFFDVKKHWGENEVKTGRSWRTDDLRIKSNTDLHKLWYILLKERNMLLTMEQECGEKGKLFPSPERLDKVKESMENLEVVVRERNKAYHMLETGEDGERPKAVVEGQLGLKFLYKHREYLIPKKLNKRWFQRHQFYPNDLDVKNFLLLYREKLYNEKRKKRNRDRNHVMGLLKRFPNMDMEALKQQYPDVDIEKCKKNRKARGHSVPE